MTAHVRLFLLIFVAPYYKVRKFEKGGNLCRLQL